MGYPKFTTQAVLSAQLSLSVMVQLTINHFIQPLASNLPSYIRDTKHFLNLIEQLPPLPPNALLVTADVTSLYTNIPHKEGIEVVLHFM